MISSVTGELSGESVAVKGAEVLTRRAAAPHSITGQ